METLVVNAGDELALFATDGYKNAEGTEKDSSIYHEGSGQAYLSKVEKGTLEEYQGEGDWFKIGNIVANIPTRWALMSAPSVCFSFHLFSLCSV